MTSHGITSFTDRYAFLSNFYSAPVYIMIGTRWVKCATVEHAYQAQKTLDPERRRMIATALSPLAAKRAGNLVKRVMYWDDVKCVIMLELLRQKFSRSALRARLLNTYDQHLLEGNTWHDNFWGECACYQCRHTVKDNSDGPYVVDAECGLNWLGRLLMRVRKDVR